MLKRFFMGNPDQYLENLIAFMAIAIGGITALALGSFYFILQIAASTVEGFIYPEIPMKALFITASVVSVLLPVFLVNLHNIRNFKNDWLYIKTGEKTHV